MVNGDSKETKGILLFDGLQEPLEPGILFNGEGLVERSGEALGNVSGIHQPFPVWILVMPYDCGLPLGL